MLTVRYTEWDGSQQVRLSPEAVFEKFAELLSYTDDADQAREWLLRNGFADVHNVAGGMIAWTRAGLATRNGPLAPGEGDLA